MKPSIRNKTHHPTHHTPLKEERNNTTLPAISTSILRETDYARLCAGGIKAPSAHRTPMRYIIHTRDNPSSLGVFTVVKSQIDPLYDAS